MKFLGKSKKKGIETLLAIDIGTENIKTVLFIVEDKEVRVLGYKVIPQEAFAMNKAIILDVDEVVNTLDKGIGGVIAEAEARNPEIALPKKMIVGIAGELVSAVPINVNVERENPDEVITADEINEVIEKVKLHAFEFNREQIAVESGLESEQISEVNTLINSISIDNILTKDPIGLTGSNVNFRVFSSFAPKIQLETIKKIAKALNLEIIGVPVEPYFLASNLVDITNSNEGAIIIDIGAGTSDVAVVVNNEIKGVKMVGIGGRSFTRRLQDLYKLNYPDAEELKFKYSNNKLDDKEVRSEVRAAFVKDAETWLLGIQIALEEMEDIEEFPGNIYICGGGSYLPEIQEGLIENGWSKVLKFKSHPKVEFLYPNKIKGVVDLTRSAVTLIDTTALSLTRFIFEK